MAIKIWKLKQKQTPTKQTLQNGGKMKNNNLCQPIDSLIGSTKTLIEIGVLKFDIAVYSYKILI